MKSARSKKITTKPIIAVTMGDPAGVGPEIVIKALSKNEIYRICRPVIIGDSPVMKRVTDILGKHLKLKSISSLEDVKGEIDTINIIDLHNIDLNNLEPGKISADCGKAAMEYIAEAAHLALDKKIDALVTAPINKEAAALAGYTDIGHLEYLARVSGARQYATMLVSGRLRVVHLSTHHSLAKACTLVTRENILARLRLTHESFIKWGFEKPGIGVAALNPHGGEGGMMGREEIEEIIPAVKDAKDSGIDARGPFPADSIFNRAINGEFDVVLAMYHDQGHIPVKVYGFEKSVSVALGLPFIRTSVDHGTAYDIAWHGKANSTSMEEAIRVAVSLYEHGKLSVNT